MFGILKFSKLDDKYEQYYKKHFFDEYCYNYVKFEGIVFREYFEIIANQIQKIDIKEDGVFVCSFLKSGTTWTQEMIWCIANDLNLTTTQQPLPKDFHF
ncbi:hypothetical protein PGB90_006241 [Kerria lacca]